MADRSLAEVLQRLREMQSGQGGLTDPELLRRFTATGDEAAFELLVRRHGGLMFGICRRILPDFHDAEDAFQAACLALARKSASISKRESVASWLYKVAYRLAIALRAKRAKEVARQRPLNAAAATAAPISVNTTAEWAEVRAALDEEVLRLPERLQAPIILCYLEGKTVDEAAFQLRCPRGTVASRLSRGRERLRAGLARRGLVIPAVAFAAALAQAGASRAAPSALVYAALKIVRAWSAGHTAAAGVSATVFSLTEEVLTVMSIKKFTIALASIIVCGGVLLVGGAWGMHLYRGVAADPRPVLAVAKGPKNPAAQQKVPPKDKPDAKKPKVSQPLQRELPGDYNEYAGRFVPSATVEVVAPVAGRLIAIHCQPGKAVKKGALLFELDAANFREELARAAANLRAAIARQKQSAAYAKRVRELPGDARTQELLEKAVLAADLDSTAMTLAELDVARAKRDLDSTKIAAPADGNVGQIQVNAGSTVTRDKTVLAALTVLDPISVVFDMDESRFRQYQDLLSKNKVKGPGSPIFVSFFKGELDFEHPGKLVSFDSRFDPNTLKIAVRGAVKNPDERILPGMFARVLMPFGKLRKVLEVPHAALLPANFDQEKTPDHAIAGPQAKVIEPFLMIINNDNVVERRPVKLGLKDREMRVILEGLRPDDWVVVEGAADLRPGDRVEPIRVVQPEGKERTKDK